MSDVTVSPRPSGPWVMAMEWRDLLFAHWPIPAAALRGLIPPTLELQTFDGWAWIGIVPFRMTNVRPRMVPSLPWISHFAELNVRTYVTAGGKPGVWFFSLDAANPLAVQVARATFHLPYFDAHMQCQPHGDGIRYRSVRTHRKAPDAALRATYCPTGPIYQSQPGTLEYWLTERYCLYAADKHGHVSRGDILHTPWPLQPAEAEFEQNEMMFQIGLRCPNTQPLLHFARYLDVVAWLPKRVKG
ncbi:MAG: DUF2071 domain-containing protein [Roseiflexaceae bacterium]|nr:DUF2071 domain-containing protein [Roseiflexaceae bacterium]